MPTPLSTLARAADIEHDLGLSPQDALIYASVVEHIHSQNPSSIKLFVTQNKRDFLIVEDELAALNCKVLFTFDSAEGYVRSKTAG